MSRTIRSRTKAPPRLPPWSRIMGGFGARSQHPRGGERGAGICQAGPGTPSPKHSPPPPPPAHQPCPSPAATSATRAPILPGPGRHLAPKAAWVWHLSQEEGGGPSSATFVRGRISGHKAGPLGWSQSDCYHPMCPALCWLMPRPGRPDFHDVGEEMPVTCS